MRHVTSWRHGIPLPSQRFAQAAGFPKFLGRITQHLLKNIKESIHVMAGVFELDLGETRDNPEDISEDDELEITDEHIEVRSHIGVTAP